MSLNKVMLIGNVGKEPEVRYVEEGTNITLPSLPTKKGYNTSWSDLDTLITEDKVFKVIYTPKTYTITYKFENSEIEDYKQTVTYGESFKLYIPDIFCVF